MANRPDYGISFADFFEAKGAFDLIYHIGYGGESFSGLTDNTELSSATISKRLKEGEHLGLWHTIAVRPDEGRSKQKYVITDRGRDVIEILGEVDFPRAYAEFLKKKKELQLTQQQIIDQIREITTVSVTEEEATDKVADQETRDELLYPWEESAAPTAEAYESIGEPRIKEQAADPFATDTMEDSEESTISSEEEIEKEEYVQQLLQALLNQTMETTDIQSNEITLGELSNRETIPDDTTLDELIVMLASGAENEQG